MAFGNVGPIAGRERSPSAPKLPWRDDDPSERSASAPYLRTTALALRIQDLWLASQAIQRDFTLLTANTKDFKDIPGLKFVTVPRCLERRCAVQALRELSGCYLRAQCARRKMRPGRMANYG